LVEKVIPNAKVVYRPPERALTGKVTVSPIEAPNHLKVEMRDGSERYIEMSSVVSINAGDSR